MTEPGYPAARIVAPKVEAHFAHHAAEARRRGRPGRVKEPDAATIEAIIDAAFWASLRREESYVPKISLALLPPEAADHPLMFERPLALEPDKLVKVAPAVERPGIHLGVWRNERGLYVWGTVRTIPALSIVVEVAAPGLLVVKHHRGDESGKFVNVAVLEGDQIKVVDEHASSLPDCPPLLSSLLGFDSPASWVKGIDSVNVLVQLAVSMRAHGRGGLLLMVPDGDAAWHESIVRPIPYGVVPAFAELAELTSTTPTGGDIQLWQDAVNRAVDAVAGLTAVDGATVLTNTYELMAFGAKIARRKGSPQVEQVTVTEPIEGDVAITIHPTQLGGTRHLSAAQFVHDQRSAVALVASQDGRFTVFAWSPCEGMVHAHRVETLLL
jgi:sensor domain DACNV-containing protein